MLAPCLSPGVRLDVMLSAAPWPRLMSESALDQPLAVRSLAQDI